MPAATRKPAATRTPIAGAVLARGEWWTVRAAQQDDTAEVLIYGDIGNNWWDDSGVTAQNLVNELREIEAATIVVRINSYGGVVAEGLAIYNALRRHPAEVVVSIDGVAVSIASLIAMAGDRVEIAANARFMVHAPWGGCLGNAVDMREMADMLDGYADSMAASYMRKTGKAKAEILALLADGQDHWYGAQQAVDFGFADAIAEAEAAEEPETESRLKAAARRFGAKFAALRGTPELATPTLAAWRPRNSLSPAKPPHTQSPHQPAAAAANHEVTPMNWKLFAAALGLSVAATADDAAARAAVCQHLGLKAESTDDEISAAAATRNVGRLAPAELAARNAGIRQAFASFRNREGFSDLEAELLADPSITLDAARARVLAKLGEGAEPLASGQPRVQAGETDREKHISAVSAALLVRAGVRKDPETGAEIVFDSANPYRGMSLRELARASLVRAGHNIGGMDALQIAQASLGMSRIRGAQTTSDFPVFLENTLHKLVLMGFRAITPVYTRFCKVGDVSDLRPWNRIVPGLLGNLDTVNEAGEYKTKNLPDGEKSSIQAKRRGNIIKITPETIINDDLGAITDTARGLGMAGPRTIDRAVFALLAQNSNLGPVLPKTNQTLFHASHNNVGSGAPSVAALALLAQNMRKQTFPGEDQELMDIGPSIALGNTLVAGDIQVVVEAQYDPDTANKLQRPNRVRGLVGDVVGTERMPATIYYLFADPNQAPVLEVVFLDGQREVRVVQDEEFSTGGIAWRGELPFGVGAIDYRGAQYSTGA